VALENRRERGRLDAVAEQELLRARELLDRRHQPYQELEVSLDGRARPAGDVGHWPVGRKNLMQHVKRPADKHDGGLQAPVLQ
jgi:hypothetical protein